MCRTRWIRRAGRNARSLKLLLAGCSGENILANLGAGSGESPGSPLPVYWLRCTWARAPEGVEHLALHPQQPGLDRGGPAKTPKERRQAMDELLLHRGLRQIFRDDRVLKGPILLGILLRLDDRLGRASVPDAVTPRPR